MYDPTKRREIAVDPVDDSKLERSVLESMIKKQVLGRYHPTIEPKFILCLPVVSCNGGI
jgi:hypothetical protein